MVEVTIPLRLNAGLASAGSQEDVLKTIQDEYVTRYLDHLGIAATPANKAAMLRYRPLDECEVQGVWEEDTSSGIANALKIAPPLRQRAPGYEDPKQTDTVLLNNLYGQPEKINVQPPAWPPGRTTEKEILFDEDFRQTEPAHLNLKDEARELAAELQRMTQHVASRSVNGAVRASDRSAGGAMPSAGASLDKDRWERLNEELELLKAKFILPFACERPLKEGSQSTELQLWPSAGSLVLSLSESKRDSVAEPISIEMDQIRRSQQQWVQDQFPLELLSTRQTPKQLAYLRSALCQPDISQMIGLLSHLLYWLVFGDLRRPGQPKLSKQGLQRLFIAANENWTQLERKYCSIPHGSSIAMNCVLLTLKHGIERCFESQYPTLFGDAYQFSLKQQLVDRINTLLMRLFDPDGNYARFPRLDGSARALALSRKLELLSTAAGPKKSKLLQGRANRATPLVRAALQVGLSSDVPPRIDPKTRHLLAAGEVGNAIFGGKGSGLEQLRSVVDLPKDKRWQDFVLQKAVLAHLGPVSSLTARGTRAHPEGATFGMGPLSSR